MRRAVYGNGRRSALTRIDRSAVGLWRRLLFRAQDPARTEEILAAEQGTDPSVDLLPEGVRGERFPDESPDVLELAALWQL